jgi:hypothetical protein
MASDMSRRVHLYGSGVRADAVAQDNIESLGSTTPASRALHLVQAENVIEPGFLVAKQANSGEARRACMARMGRPTSTRRFSYCHSR